MKQALVLIFLTICYVRVRACESNNCTSDDEFENGKVTTEFETFINTLTNFTFMEYGLNCENKTEIKLIIDYNDQILWDIRFEIYNERYDKTQKTLDDCYCEFTDCKSLEFRQCLADARQAMTSDIENVMVPKIAAELQKRAELC